ncbi:hypothetical protein [Rubrivirga sp.]|uniref:hypothetical protein n=1 Tax=Rubrivirga sp. TaxID=1885344 RepID=UPI003C7564C7
MALEGGALGARLTGAGFGGCVVALAEPDHADALAATIAEAYRKRTALEGATFVVRDNHQASVERATA